MGLRAGLDGRKISSPLGFDPGPSSPYSVAIPTELPGPRPVCVCVCVYHCLIKCTIFGKNVIEHKMCILILLQFLSETFLLY